MSDVANKPKSFPTALVVIVMVILFILVFLGSFTFSFVKSRVMKLAANKMNTLQNLGTGNLSGLPAGLAGLAANPSSGNKNADQGGENAVVSDDSANDLKICQKGTFFQTSDGRATITGKENISFEGKTSEVCCYELSTVTDEGISDTNKTCMFVNDPNNTVIYKKRDSKYVIWGAVIVDNGSQCNYIYGDGGALESKTCF